MPTGNVVLTTHHESVIEALVSSGRFQNAREVLCEGLGLVEAREARDAARLRALQDVAAVGFTDLDEDRYRAIPDDKIDKVITMLGHRTAQASGV